MASIISFHTPFNKGRIIRRGQHVDMEVEGATFATWHPDRLLTGYSWDAMSAAALLHSSPNPCEILLLGLAGGTMIRILRTVLPHARMTAVEIDGALVEICATHMHWADTDCRVVIGDAYAYLARTRRRFDVILDDVFLSGAADVYRPHTPDGNTSRLYRRVMRPNGIVAVNCITDGPHRKHLRAMRHHLAEEFSQLRRVIAPRGYNAALVAGDALAPSQTVRDRVGAFANESDRAWWRMLRIRK